MRKQSRVFIATLVVWLGALAMNANAQDKITAGDVSAVRVVNVVAAGKGKLKVEVVGSTSWKKDLRLGRRTGGIGMKKGSYEFVLSKEGCVTSSKTIKLEGGKSQTLVAYSEPVRDDTGNIVNWDLRLARLAQYDPEDGTFMTIVSFLESQKTPLRIEEVMGGTETSVVAERLKVERLALPEGDSLSYIFSDKDRITKLGARESGNYIVLLYEDEEGKKSSVNFYDPKFVLAE